MDNKTLRLSITIFAEEGIGAGIGRAGRRMQAGVITGERRLWFGEQAQLYSREEHVWRLFVSGNDVEEFVVAARIISDARGQVGIQR